MCCDISHQILAVPRSANWKSVKKIQLLSLCWYMRSGFILEIPFNFQAVPCRSCLHSHHWWHPSPGGGGSAQAGLGWISRFPTGSYNFPYIWSAEKIEELSQTIEETTEKFQFLPPLKQQNEKSGNYIFFWQSTFQRVKEIETDNPDIFLIIWHTEMEQKAKWPILG